MKITQRLTLLFLVVSLSFTAFIFTFFQIKKQETVIYQKADVLQRRQIINAFIDIKKASLMSLLDSYSIWDELYHYTSYPSYNWAQANLKSLISDYNLDLVQVYDSTGKVVFSTASAKEPELQKTLFPSGFFTTMNKERRSSSRTSSSGTNRSTRQ